MARFYFLFIMLAPSALCQELLVVRGDGDYSPFEMEVNGELVGFHIELVNIIAKQNKLNVHFESYPWARALTMMKNGEAHAITFVGKAPEREQYIIFKDGNEISWTQSGLMVLEKRKHLFTFNGKNLDSLRSFKFGNSRGFIYGDFYDNAQLNKQEFSTYDQLFGMLRLERIDLAIMNYEEFMIKKAANEANVQGVVMLDEYIKLANYIGFSKGYKLEKVAIEFASALNVFKKTPQFMKLKIKYAIKD